ncbi:hypothetical protein QSJ18_11855 [Gordonia sp. ABSL1-1]|uniref:hypothetical protein n=1 Tax=Gordonia sp. ABSL1-1 TaxID=3053923 RepID=UPI0025739FAF|nr:hypothetical protein [Gordonia sp. ABSL1-1]MDL9937441.1 hypothetical protein [Gordonia sp. ABSL1-1]
MTERDTSRNDKENPDEQKPDEPDTGGQGTGTVGDTAAVTRPQGKSGRKRVRPGDTPADADADADADTATADTETVVASKPPTSGTVRSGRQVTVTLTGSGLLKALAAAVVIGLIVVIGVLAAKLHDRNQQLDAFDDSIAASKHFVNELVATMKSSNSDQTKERLGPLSTGAFNDRLQRESAETTDQANGLKVTSASADIKLATVEKFTADSATTLVQAEVTASGANSTAPQKAVFFYLIQLEKHDGKWLVADIGPAPGTGVMIGDGTQANPKAVPTRPEAPTGAPTPGAPTPAPTPAG